MATAEEILQTMAEVPESAPACVIDPETRTIIVPPEYQLFGVENDKRTERLYFQCPKIVGDNQDLSQNYQLFMNYQNANGDPDAYHIEDMEVDGDNITFSWLLEENVTKYRGNIQFAFGAIIPGDEAEDPDKNRWNTTINTDCTCLVGLKCTQQVAESNPDALVQIWAAIDELKAGGGGGTGGTTNYNNLSNKPQLNGVTLEGNKTLDQVGVLAKNQGSNNSGKFLSVGSDGNVVPEDAPSGGTVDPEQIKQAVNGYLEENPVSGMTAEQEQQLNQNTADVADLKSALEQIEGSGWNSTQIDLFEALTNVIVYTSPNASDIVNSLITSLRNESSDVPKDSYSVIYSLSNVVSSNITNSIKTGETYITTLNANRGYLLSSVSVKMGGIDITNDVYSDGTINIPSVTGNVIITAIAILATSYVANGLIHEFTNLNGPKIISGGQEIFTTPNNFTVFVAAKKTETMSNYNHSWVAGETSREFDFWRNWNGSVNVKQYHENLSLYTNLNYTPDNLDEMIYACCKQEERKLYLYDKGILKSSSKEVTSFSNLSGDLTINANSVMPKILIYNRALTDEEIKQNISVMTTEVGE